VIGRAGSGRRANGGRLEAQVGLEAEAQVGVDVGRVALAGTRQAITKLNGINLVLKLTEIFA
jgi:hypothetical protein